MRPLLVSFILVLALAIAGSAQRAQPMPQRVAPPATPAATASEPSKDATDRFESLVRPFVTENCVACHGYKKQKNGLNLESYESAASLTDVRPMLAGRI